MVNLALKMILAEANMEAVELMKKAGTIADGDLVIITKGDLHHQLRRIADADVARFCFDIEVVAEKDPATYRRMLSRHRIEPPEFVMVGNSLVSDVAPVVEVGSRAIHIPYETTWALETADSDPPFPERWTRVDSIREVPGVLETLAADVAASLP